MWKCLVSPRKRCAKGSGDPEDLWQRKQEYLSLHSPQKTERAKIHFRCTKSKKGKIISPYEIFNIQYLMLVPLISPLLWERVCVCVWEPEKGRRMEIDSSDEWEAWKIRWYKGLWNVRVSTVLGTFEAHSMTNHIISQLRKFLETKMNGKIKVFGKWGHSFVLNPAVSFALCDVKIGEGGTWGWDGLGRRFYLHTPQLGSGGGSGCRVRMQIGLPRMANQQSG